MQKTWHRHNITNNNDNNKKQLKFITGIKETTTKEKYFYSKI